MIEHLTQARESVRAACTQLMDAHKGSSALESLLLSPLIGDAARLQLNIEAVLSALKAKE